MVKKSKKVTAPEPDKDYFFVHADGQDGVDPAGLDAYVGMLAMEFNMLDSLTIGLMARLLRLDGFAAQAVWSNMLWKPRLEFINAAFVRRHDLEPLTPFWVRLYNFMVELGGERNFIIHGERVESCHDDGSSAFYVSGNDAADFWNFSRRPHQLIDESEIRELILDVRAAVIGLCALDNHILLAEPSLDTLLKAAVRRRPPRHARKSANSAKPQNPPQPSGA